MTHLICALFIEYGTNLFHSKILYKIYSMHLNTRQDHTACITDRGVSTLTLADLGSYIGLFHKRFHFTTSPSLGKR